MNKTRPKLKETLENLSKKDGAPGKPWLGEILKNPELRKSIMHWFGQAKTAQAIHGLDIKELGIDLLAQEEELSTSSSAEELATYKKRLEKRAMWLEALLSETRSELERIEKFLAPPASPRPHRTKRSPRKARRS